MTAPAVVVVEDERIVALHLKQQLTTLGYNVLATAANGENALRKIEKHNPDVVLMDIHIEGAIDGIETAALIPPERDVPVIYLTAYSEEATLERARATKPYGYLIKPYSERELHATIQMALERRRGAAALRASEDRFRTIVSAIREGIFIIDAATGTIKEANEPGCTMFGYVEEELVGCGLNALSHGSPPHTGDEIAGLVREAATAATSRRFDWHCRTKDGRAFWAELTLSSASIGGQTVVLSVVHDLTKRRAIEDELRQSQKMEAVGQLTGGVAHDFNNLLAIMHGNLELLEDHVGADPEAAELINDALDAAKRGASLTHRLLAFSRQQQLAPSSIDVGAVVTGLISILRRVVEEPVQIVTLIAPDLWRCMIDGRELENAMLNLALNARDAMPGGGILTITVENTFVDDDAVATDMKAGRYVMISVTDTGVGMPKDVVDRALDPFFTTKPVGKGTGLGLPMVYGFVRQSGGHLAIHSEPGLGTTVNLYLPQLSSEPTPASVERNIAAPVAEAQTVILVVEDDPALRKVQLRVLASLHYQTLEAADGVSGLEILASEARVDLLMTDIVLPGGMSGPDLVDAARRIRPDLKVVFVSGYAPPAIMDRYNQSGAHVLSKPFTQTDLAHAVRAALG